MKPFGKTRKLAASLIVALGVVTFFMPLISINAPIIGRMQWSALNIWRANHEESRKRIGKLLCLHSSPFAVCRKSSEGEVCPFTT